MAEETTVPIRMERRIVSPETPPVPIQHFLLTRVGGQVLLEPGYIDLVELRTALEMSRNVLGADSGGEDETTATVQLVIKERYILDREGLMRLRSAVDEILAGMNEPKGDQP